MESLLQSFSLPDPISEETSSADTSTLDNLLQGLTGQSQDAPTDGSWMDSIYPGLSSSDAVSQDAVSNPASSMMDSLLKGLTTPDPVFQDMNTIDNMAESDDDYWPIHRLHFNIQNKILYKIVNI